MSSRKIIPDKSARPSPCLIPLTSSCMMEDCLSVGSTNGLKQITEHRTVRTVYGLHTKYVHSLLMRDVSLDDVRVPT